MVILSENDYLDVKLNSLIADYDVETLSNLYQPIIGYAALAIYFTLVAEAKNQKVTSMTSHSQILNRLQMAPGTFIEARKHLEGVGLVRTFLEKQNDTTIYHYQIYSPKAPYNFFEDTLLFGMLIKAIGDVDANRFKMIYHFSKEEENGKDISSSFIEVYNPNFDDPAFLKAMNGAPSIGRNTAKVRSGFNYDLFFTNLGEISQITSAAFTKKDMKEIERLATLNGISEQEAAYAVSSIYEPSAPKGKHIDFKQLTRLFQEQTDYSYLLSKKLNRGPNMVSGKSELAGKINIMETRSPKEFLAILQNGSQPASSDLKIVDDLSKKFQLNNCVINVIIDYVLSTNDNILSRAFSEKIAASLAREGIETTIDAMNYLKRVSRGGRKSTNSDNLEEKPANTAQKEQKSQEKELNWDEMLDDLDNDDGGESNGKA